MVYTTLYNGYDPPSPHLQNFNVHDVPGVIEMSFFVSESFQHAAARQA